MLRYAKEKDRKLIITTHKNLFLYFPAKVNSQSLVTLLMENKRIHKPLDECPASHPSLVCPLAAIKNFADELAGP